MYDLSRYSIDDMSGSSVPTGAVISATKVSNSDSRVHEGSDNTSDIRRDNTSDSRPASKSDSRPASGSEGHDDVRSVLKDKESPRVRRRSSVTFTEHLNKP